MKNKPLVENLVKDLWACYEQEIRSGYPVYFCFHRSQIRSILIKNGIRSADYVEEFLNIARSYLFVAGEYASVRAELFSQVIGKHSSVIILIAFQILAVELMDKDDQGIGEDAYFPRLRKLISIKLDPKGRLPFKEEDFYRIWTEFRDEILFHGGRPESITFSEGIGRKDKNRNFPISQALLSQAELMKVCRIFYSSVQGMPRQVEIPILLKKLRNDLPDRVKEKLSRPIQRVKILEQIYMSFKTLPIDVLANRDLESSDVAALDDVILKAFLEGVSEEYLFIEGWTTQNEKKDLFSSDVVNILDRQQLLILGRFSKNQLYWTNDISCSLSELEDFVVIFRKERKGFFNVFKERCLANEVNEVTTKSEFKDFVVVRYERSSLHADCVIKDGIPKIDKQQILIKDLQFKGGLRVSRGRFIIGFPFFGISIEGASISSSDFGRLNGERKTVAEILEIFNRAIAGDSFIFEFDEVIETITFVAPEPKKENIINYGYEVLSNKIVPTKKIIKDRKSWLFQFKFINNEIYAAVNTLQNYLFLLNPLNFEDGKEATEEQAEMLAIAIDSLRIQSYLKKIMLLNLKTTNRIPRILEPYF